MRTFIAGLACLGSLVAPVASSTALNTPAAGETLAVQAAPAFFVEDPRVGSLPALAQSTRLSRVYYTLDGRVDRTRLIALGRDGATRGALRVLGARNVSWQDLDAGPRNSLYVADVGDPAQVRREIAVYRVHEPRNPLQASTAQARRFALTYPDGRHHSQAIMVRPGTGRVFVVTKDADGGGVYRAPKRLVADRRNQLVRIGSAPAGATGAGYGPDGTSYVIGTADQVYEYSSDGTLQAAAAKPTAASSGKSLVVEDSGSDILVGTTSRSPSPVYRMPMPSSRTLSAPTASLLTSLQGTYTDPTTQIGMQWEPVSSVAAQGYRFGYSTTDPREPEPGWTSPVIPLSSADRPFVFTTLVPGVTYDVFVEVVDDRGRSARTTLRATAGQPQQQPGTPTDLSVSGLTTTTMTLNWQPPTSAGSSAINGYQVGWGTWESAMLPSGTRSMELTNFAADTEYKLRVRAHNDAGYGPWAYITVRTPSGSGGSGGSEAPSALPSRVVAGYWPSWSSTRLTALPTGTSGYNTIFLAFATPGTSDPGGGTGAVTYRHSNFSHATIKSDIASLRAKGVPVILSVGGAGNYTHLDTDARRNAFYQSIKTIYDQIGPFDGLDWNFETNWSYQGTVYNQGVTTAKGTLPRILWICRALKNDYPGFLFTKPPSPSSEHDRTWIKAMNDQGTFDLVMPQYYDGGGSGFPNNISFWTSSSGVGTASKVAPGLIDNERYSQYGSGTGTQASINTRWATATSTYPGLRGAMYWHTGIDAQTTGGSQAYWFANNFGAKVRTR